MGSCEMTDSSKDAAAPMPASGEHLSAHSGVIPQSPQDAPRPLEHATSARRMRLHRARRQKDLRCLTVELREREVEALVAKGLLPSNSRDDTAAIRKALYSYLDGTLGRSL
jgi:hypothetical protein